ncbi:hypothetical protein CBR_g5742 [Chara braunii]|uniref:Uncharacterized protein n=1 Tax=Chara braunii TaxID=69332 RepID=A0A388KJ81_CHABU|nr:hypothetical protein CBR_g5742 [Chara braunii]|eukprot:GBG70111.1 hypothetical protein CBR_g5742 [Chara braunii]
MFWCRIRFATGEGSVLLLVCFITSAGMDLMRSVNNKLIRLNCPYASMPYESMLYAGDGRYKLLEWLFNRLLGEKSPFARHSPVSSDGMLDEDESVQTMRLAEIAKFLGLTETSNTEIIQGQGTYEARAKFLHLVTDLVEASQFADTPEWSVDEQAARDVQLLDALCEKQAVVLSEECNLFPRDTQFNMVQSVPPISALESQLAEYSKEVDHLHQLVNELAKKRIYNANEHSAIADKDVQEKLALFIETARTFNVVFTKEIQPWTHRMERPQLHGLGPASKHIRDCYETLMRLLRGLRTIKDSCMALGGGMPADSGGREVSSPMGPAISAKSLSLLTRLSNECEEALKVLKDGERILAQAMPRYMQKRMQRPNVRSS